MSKLSNLLEKDVRIVQRKKLIFLIPICFFALAIIMAIVYQFTLGSALNLGMDFSGGYTINVNIGVNMTEENADEYKDIVRGIVEGYSDAEGNNYGVKVSQILETGEGDDRALQVKFKSVTGEETMEEIVEGIRSELEKTVTNIVPTVVKSGSTVKVTFANYAVSPDKDIFVSKLGKVGIDVTADALTVDENSPDTFSFTYSGSLGEDELSQALTIASPFSAKVYTNGKIGATVSRDLLYNTISAILIALVLMLAYIAIRFEFRSGVSAIVALVHDLAVIFSFMIIFHIEFNSTFIAALITILGYSINNAIILFDRVRSNTKIYPNWDKATLANRSIAQSFIRCMNTTITTVIMIGSVAVVCAIASLFNPDLYQMVTFSLPIIVGLLSGLYSSMFVAPSVWCTLNKGTQKRRNTATAEAKD